MLLMFSRNKNAIRKKVAVHVVAAAVVAGAVDFVFPLTTFFYEFNQTQCNEKEWLFMNRLSWNDH